MPSNRYLKRTIGQARADGYTHLEIYCPGCNCTTAMPWVLLDWPLDTVIETMQPSLRCRRCGPEAPEPVIEGVWRQQSVPGFVRTA